jgi:thioredoxin-related protein
MITFIIGIFAGVTLGQREKPIPATEIMNVAYKEAKSSNKNIFLIFQASWCGWCKRLEKVLETPEVKEIMEDNFIIARLDVLEREEKIAELENPGGKEILIKYGGDNSGLPFYVFLDPKGNRLANSNVMPKNMNIGFPGTSEELDAFKSLLKKTSKKITDDQFNLIIDTIKKNLPPPKKQD